MGLTSEVVATNDVQVGERDGEPRGFYTLLHRGPLVVLDDLWLEPAEIGHGSGRLLFEHAAARALRSGRGRAGVGGRAVRGRLLHTDGRSHRALDRLRSGAEAARDAAAADLSGRPGGRDGMLTPC